MDASLSSRALVTLEEWESSGSYFSYHNYSIFFRCNCVNKPTLLLIHGFPTSSWDYSFLWPNLVHNFNVMAIDMLGFGLSDKPLYHHYSTIEQADIISAIVLNNNVREVHILAHDYGDTVAQELIARHNEGGSEIAILSTCFLNGGLFPETHSPTLLQAILASQWGKYFSFFMIKPIVCRALSDLFGQKYKPAKTELNIMWGLVAHKKGGKISNRLLQYIDERKKFRQRWVGAISKTNVALLLINGPDDPVSGINMVESYRANVANPEVVLLEGVGHFPHIEVPDEVYNAYMTFYERIAG